MPDISILPGVGLRVYNAARVAGEMNDPTRSVLKTRGEYLAESPTGGPMEEPLELCSSAR